MTWVKEYQSRMCCEFSALCTTPCHSLMVPQVHIGTRPIAQSRSACRRSSTGAASRKAQGGMRRAPITGLSWRALQRLHRDVAVGVDADVGGDVHRLAYDRLGIERSVDQCARGGQGIIAAGADAQ